MLTLLRIRRLDMERLDMERLDMERLDMERLADLFAEILPRVATEDLGGMDPDIFAEHFRYMRKQFEASETP
jgi:hypothetical protein